MERWKEEEMAYYPLIQLDASPATAFGHCRLPTFYMQDFSVLGLRVDDCGRALAILERHGYGWRRARSVAEIAIASPSGLLDVVHLLNANGVQCDLADIAGGMYQG
jgi:hypothetical protein